MGNRVKHFYVTPILSVSLFNDNAQKEAEYQEAKAKTQQKTSSRRSHLHRLKLIVATVQLSNHHPSFQAL
jgi:hypothetical protein